MIVYGVLLSTAFSLVLTDLSEHSSGRSEQPDKGLFQAPFGAFHPLATLKEPEFSVRAEVG